MIENLLNLQLSEQAIIAYDLLGSEERRLVDAWFDHLRNWRSDEFIRSRSKVIDSDEDLYVFQTSDDIVIAFRILGNEVTVVSIFRKDALRAFERVAGRSAP